MTDISCTYARTVKVIGSMCFSFRHLIVSRFHVGLSQATRTENCRLPQGAPAEIRSADWLVV
jgi:hypothetical protein